MPGEAMILRTIWGGRLSDLTNFKSLFRNGTIEEWVNTAAVPDGWSWYFGAETPTFSRQAGSLGGGTGAYYLKAAFAAPPSGILGALQQTVQLKGGGSFDARGQYGREFTIAVWFSSDRSIQSIFEVREKNAAGTTLVTHNNSYSVHSGATERTYSFTVAHAETVQLHCSFTVFRYDAGAQYIAFDDAKLYRSYTFAVNPSVPDDQVLSVPDRKFSRTIGSTLLLARPDAGCAKIQKSLHFGLIGLTQLEEFRSLWLCDSPMTWWAYHPHLPVTVVVRWTNDFDFRLVGKSFGANHYGGNMVLTEV